MVQDASEDPERFEPGAVLRAGGEEVRVEERKRPGGRLVIRLDKPVSRGTPLEIPRSSLPAPGPCEYYVFQLVVSTSRGGRARRGRTTCTRPCERRARVDTAGRSLVEACSAGRLPDTILAHGIRASTN